jgi:hypothetical protein
MPANNEPVAQVVGFARAKRQSARWVILVPTCLLETAMPRVMLVVWAFALCAVSAAPVIAQTGFSGVATSVMTLDRNFDIADKNHDGLLSKDEANAGHVPFIVKNFDAIDTQHRGLVSKADVHNFIKQGLGRNSPTPAASTKQN